MYLKTLVHSYGFDNQNKKDIRLDSYEFRMRYTFFNVHKAKQFNFFIHGTIKKNDFCHLKAECE